LSLLRPRATFSPFEYPQVFEYFTKQNQARWLWTEIPMAGDITDWNSKLTASEKNVVTGILKGFVTTEVLVQEYWTSRVFKWFPKPEVKAMCSAFGNTEAVHAKSYNYLAESLGLTDFDAYINEPTAKAKIDHILDTNGKSKEAIAKSLAVFSGFTEGVNLFSSFAVLLNFSRFNKLKGVGQIISWSIRDESLHSEAGCYLFRTLVKENPEIFTKEFKDDIYEAARLTVKLEDDFIDMVFKEGPIEGLDPNDLKAYIRFRCNTKLADLSLGQNWKTLDKEAVSRVSSWFDALSSGIQLQDFFAGPVTDYSSGHVEWTIEKVFK
jgi:ribonucleoside-diphosphate reductase beta chain